MPNLYQTSLSNFFQKMPILDEVLKSKLLGKKLPSKQNSSLDQKLKLSNNANSVLNSSVQFVPAKRPFEDESMDLKSKYRRLRAPSQKSNGYSHGHMDNPSTSNFDDLYESSVVRNKPKPVIDEIPPPIFDIYPDDAVRIDWDQKFKRSTAIGLSNLGNTCFLNSVLQVLTNTAPLVNYLLNNEHDSRRCPAVASGFCALCLMKSHLQRVFAASNGSFFAPHAIVNRVRCFMKSHTMGRQEDAHEFLRYFIDAMQSAALHPFKSRKLDLYTKETSIIGRIFGGFHKNEVICNKCKFSSVTYDPFLDLSVEVKQATSLTMALGHFTRTEILTHDNAYKCPRCKIRVSARKMFTIHQAPNVLTVQLKRFDHHLGKIDRLISYPEKLSLRPYMTEKQGPPVNYKLYGVVNHHGRSTRSGHYTAYARNPCNQWHFLDDDRAAPASQERALNSTGAYLLFYVRVPTPVIAVRPQPQSASNSPKKAMNENPITFKMTMAQTALNLPKKFVNESIQSPRKRNENSITFNKIASSTPPNSPKKIVDELIQSPRKRNENTSMFNKIASSTAPSSPKKIVDESDQPSRKRKRKDKEKRKKQKLKKARLTDEPDPEENGTAVESNGRDAAKELGKSHAFGYGGSVKSWFGSTNVVDQQTADEEDPEMNDGEEADGWNQEFDKGRVKKKKKRRGQFMCMGLNPFQSAQNSKNRREKFKFLRF